MLKIKDNVDLNELEKFGLKPNYDINTGKLKKFIKRDNQNNEIFIIRFVENDHCRDPYFEIHWLCDGLTLYDLIQAGLVEKLVEKEE